MGLYHPPPTDGMTTTMFLDKVTKLLMALTPKYNNIMLLEDFNMHIDDTSNPDNIIFNDTMVAPGLIQHVNLDNTALLKEIKSIDKPHKPYYNKFIRNQ